MSKLRVINDEDVRKILDIKNTIKLVEEAFVMKADGSAKILPIITEEIEKGCSEFDIKSGIMPGSEVFGVKLVSWYAHNKAIGLPAINGLMMVYDYNNGIPIGLVNAQYLTAMRTGAAGAIGVKYLANENSSTLLMIGTGNQAIFQIAFTLHIKNTIKKVYVFNPRSYEKAQLFICKII